MVTSSKKSVSPTRFCRIRNDVVYMTCAAWKVLRRVEVEVNSGRFISSFV
ncbi:hypothetical protein OESDEN_09771 [Oesophagostomum dentatum]|uniref:Uncharacterized protein n=1 Tax=Oesophagostomum dentatum TaxID=61180 RepID=A0A0B1T2K1_OESDE|nr:hypothetical protein OESDEN_09771 [Oesophagostomum dentatum]